jgi:hypothetical protein
MLKKKLFAAYAAALPLLLSQATAHADEHPYNQGPVVNVQGVRTEYGRFDEYMSYLASTWKQEQEAAKKAGYIVSYSVLTTQPRSEHDPDIYLVVTYKNWAALDNANERADAILKQVVGSVSAANQGAVDRSKLRRVISSETMQELVLK